VKTIYIFSVQWFLRFQTTRNNLNVTSKQLEQKLTSFLCVTIYD